MDTYFAKEENIEFINQTCFYYVVHGNWRAIEKYHLVQSQNPIEHGLHSFPQNSNTFAGILPAFLALIVCVDTTKSFLELVQLKEKLAGIYEDISACGDKLAREYLDVYFPEN